MGINKLDGSSVQHTQTTSNTATSSAAGKTGTDAQLATRLTGTETPGVRKSAEHNASSHAPTLASRHVEEAATDPLRLQMRDIRNLARKAIEHGNVQEALAQCTKLRNQSQQALASGDEALGNGGIMALGELGVAMVNDGADDAAAKIARLAAETGKASLRHGVAGPAHTATAAVTTMRDTALRNGNQPLADTLMRTLLDISGEKPGNLETPMLHGGQRAIAANNLHELKVILDDTQAAVRSARDVDFATALTAAIKVMAGLTRAAWEHKDEALANTIGLQFNDLAGEALHRQKADGVVEIVLAANQLRADAKAHGFAQTGAIMGSVAEQALARSGQLPGGAVTLLTRFPIDPDALVAAATETTQGALAAVAHGNRAAALELVATLKDIGEALIRKGAADRAPAVANQLGSIGAAAAKAGQLAVVDSVTDDIALLGDFAARTGYRSVAERITSAQASFADAWSMAQQHTAIKG